MDILAKQSEWDSKNHRASLLWFLTLHDYFEQLRAISLVHLLE